MFTSQLNNLKSGINNGTRVNVKIVSLVCWVFIIQ